MLQIINNSASSEQSILDEWSRNYEPGRPVPVNFRAVTGLSSAVDRYTHLLHPYPAKLLAAIPAFFLRCPEVTGIAPRVLDPFCGSGTVLVEGMASGGEVVGCDVNPLARLISAAKTTVISTDRLHVAFEAAMRHLPCRGTPPPPGPVQLERWFAPKVARQISRLTSAIRVCEDTDAKVFLEACLSVVIHRTSLADPTVSVPVKIDAERPGLSDEQRSARRKWLRERKRADAISIFKEVFSINAGRMRRLAAQVGVGARATLCADARNFSDEDGIDLVITSPPYGSAQKYVRSTSLSLQWLGLVPDGLRAIERQTIGREHFTHEELKNEQSALFNTAAPVLARIREKNPLRAHIAGQFLAEMEQAITSISTTLKSGGTLVLVVGDNLVCGEKFSTSEYLSAIVQAHGMTLEVELVDKIKSRGLITRRAASAGLITDEWIGVFRKS